MRRHIIERLTATAGFRLTHVFAGLLVFPVLSLGLLVTLSMLGESQGLPPEDVAIAALSLGGALGMAGWIRSMFGARAPERHNITATLVCLALGAATALAVCGYLVTEALEMLLSPWAPTSTLVWFAVFGTANVVWILAGVGSMQRLPRLYAARTGKAFDGLPVVLLFVAVSLAIAAALALAML